MLQEGLQGVVVDGVHQRGDGHGAHEVQQAVQAARLAVAAGPRYGRHLAPSRHGHSHLLLLLLLLQGDLLHQLVGVDVAHHPDSGRDLGGGGAGDDDVAHGHVVGRAEAVAVGGGGGAGEGLQGGAGAAGAHRHALHRGGCNNTHQHFLKFCFYIIIVIIVIIIVIIIVVTIIIIIIISYCYYYFYFFFKLLLMEGGEGLLQFFF